MLLVKYLPYFWQFFQFAIYCTVLNLESEILYIQCTAFILSYFNMTSLYLHQSQNTTTYHTLVTITRAWHDHHVKIPIRAHPDIGNSKDTDLVTLSNFQNR